MVLILATVSTVTSVTLAVFKIVQTCQEINSEGKIISSNFSNKLIVDIDEPEIYEAVEIYLGNNLSSNEWQFGIIKPEKDKNFKIINEAIDFYEGHKFKWESNSKAKKFKLTFHKKNKDLVLPDYLPYIMKEAKLSKKVASTEEKVGMEKDMQLLTYIILIMCFVIIFVLMIVIIKA